MRPRAACRHHPHREHRHRLHPVGPRRAGTFRRRLRRLRRPEHDPCLLRFQHRCAQHSSQKRRRARLPVRRRHPGPPDRRRSAAVARGRRQRPWARPVRLVDPRTRPAYRPNLLHLHRKFFATSGTQGLCCPGLRSQYTRIGLMIACTAPVMRDGPSVKKPSYTPSATASPASTFSRM